MSMGEERIKTSEAELWLEDGIYFITDSKGKKGTLETATDKLSAHREYSGGRKLPLFANVRGMKGASPEARDLWNSEEVTITCASVRILIGSAFTRSIGSPFMKINKPPYPVKVFTEKEEALKWLEQYSEQVERSNKELELFAYVASHDLARTTADGEQLYPKAKTQIRRQTR